MLATYARLAENAPYSPDAAAAGRRALRNAALDLLAAGDRVEGAMLALRQFESADTMTDEIAALATLAHAPGARARAALDAFYRAHAGEALVIDKWFALQAMIPESDTLPECGAADEPSKPFRSQIRTACARSSAPSPPAIRPSSTRSTAAAMISSQQSFSSSIAKIRRSRPGFLRRSRVGDRSKRNGGSLRRTALRRVASADGLSPDVKDIAERSLA